MIVVARPEGHVAVAQTAHARTCAQLGRAWGNERFGSVEPLEEVCLAAEEHEAGMTEWDLAPTLDPATGLPETVRSMDLDVHLPLRIEGPRRLADRSPYAALLASMHHTSFFAPPGRLGRLRETGRQIGDFLDRSEVFQRELRPTVDASDEDIERNWRLVRAWDGLSHDVMLERAPCTREAVPAADGERVDLRLTRRDGAHAVDPWPFAAEAVALRTEGRLLGRTFDDQEEMREALARAPLIELSYELVPA